MIVKKVIYGCEEHGDKDSAYMTRYILLDTKMGALCCHVFHRSDDRIEHDHPWNFWTLILWRGYNEVTPKGVKRIWPGQALYRPATWRHRVELIKERPAVTLVWKSTRLREWGFFLPSGWQNWKTYFQERGC